MNGTAIVVGGGIGGLAAARALGRTGWEVTLFEQAPTFGAVGAGITLAPNAVRALDWLGLGAELRSRGMAHGAAGIRTASGRWLIRTRIEELKERFGVPAFALHRADLHHMLTEAICAEMLRTGHRVTSVSNEGDKTTVAFDGPEGPGKASADLVVAAYDQTRRPRTQGLVRVSGQIGKVAQWRNPVAATARNLLARLITPNTYLRSSSETFSWTPPAADYLES